MKSCSAVVIFTEFESNHISNIVLPNFKNIQTDQSECNIFIDCDQILFYALFHQNTVYGFLVDRCHVTLLKYVKSQRSYGFLITKELIFGFQLLDHFSASLSPVYMNTFLWRTISFSIKTQQLYSIYTSFSYRFHIVFSRLHENNEND